METITTDKEAFFHVRNHLLSQGEPAFDIDDNCGYLGHTRSQIDKIRQMMPPFVDPDELNEEYDDRDYYFLMENWDSLPYAKCAVGCLIYGSNYEPSFEGNSIDDRDVFNAVVNSNPEWKEPSINMMLILQKIHDRISSDSWEKIFDPQNWNFNLDGDFVMYSGFMEETVVPNYVNK